MPPRIGVWLGALLVAASAAWVHWPVLSSTAIIIDDHKWLIDSRLVRSPGWDAVRRAFTQVVQPADVPAYYHPLTLVSFMVDRQISRAADFLPTVRRTNLMLHVLNSALLVWLLYLVFERTWIATLAALVFAVHPLTVEPVAWMVERKTLLAATFTFLCLILYVLHARRASWWAYGAAILTCALALLSKPSAVPLPLLLLVLDYWPLRRLRWGVLLEKVPFLALAGAAAVITAVSQARTTDIPGVHAQPLPTTLLMIGYNASFYVWKAIYPVALAPLYPIPHPFALQNPAVAVGLVGTLLLVGGLIVSLYLTRALLAGWLFFFLAILPAAGPGQAVEWIASDKYAYLAAPGLLLLLGALLQAMGGSPRGRGSWTGRRVLTYACGVAACLLLARTSRAQLEHWQSTESIYRHIIHHAPQNAGAHSDLALELGRLGAHDEALAHLRTAVQLKPRSAMARTNLALALDRRGDTAGSVQELETVLRAEPGYAWAAYHLGRIQLAIGDIDAALGHLQRSVQSAPGSDYAQCRVGTLLAKAGRPAAALPYFEAALHINPDYAEAHNDLANALVSLGRPAEAITHYQRALELRPERATGYVNLGDAWAAVGKLDTAMECYRAALGLDNTCLEAYRRLGEMLVRQRNPEAIRVYEAALRVAPQDAHLRAALEQARALGALPRAGGESPAAEASHP